MDDEKTSFRHGYLDYQALTRQLRQWADTYPEFAHLHSIGTTPEGREIWMLTVGSEPQRIRPAVWVDGNMHGAELAGSSVALAVAQAALRLHQDAEPPPFGLPEHVRERLREVLFHICPRMSPDGAEAMLTRGGFVRSAPRDRPAADNRPRWRPQDLDGDGICRYLRVRDNAGDFVESQRHPGLMLPRRVEDPPPYWKLYPEGVIEDWDGEHIPEPEMLRYTTDFNRNFPWSWQPEPEQMGAGDYPGSEPETRSIIEFATSHPNLYAWLNLHTFGGVFIRPLIDGPDNRMDQGDLALYRQLAAWAEELVGYPTVSGYEEFTYEPDTPLRGDLTDYAYHQRGCLAQVCELWDLFHRIGQPKPKRFVDHYTGLSRNDMERLARWDAEHNGHRVFGRWQPLQHPQLGSAEVGGADPRIGIWNPPPELLPEICDGIAAYWLRVAALLPHLEIEELRCTALGGGHFELQLTVANHGYLPSHGVNAARDRPWNAPIRARVETAQCRLRETQSAQRDLGHLDGWGRGLGEGAHMPWYQRSRGTSHRITTRWLIKGEGRATVSVGNPRLGTLTRTINIR